MRESGAAIGLERDLGGAAAGDFIALMKPRVMSLVLFTALVGLVLAPGAIHPLTALTGLIAIGVGAGAAGALNMWFDADIDATMQRTRLRPIPRGRVTREEALGFGVTLAAGSVVVMGVLVNWVAAGLLALTVGFYIFIYTMWLKRRTAQNIVIGGAAGAFPPAIGWAAVTGGVSIEPIVLCLIIFLWTPPHFWALALLKARDYELAGVPMLPVVAGPDETRRQILIYAVLMALVALVPLGLGMAGVVYGLAALGLGLLFVIASWQVFRRRQGAEADRAARRLFGFSILYLFAIFAALLGEAVAGRVPLASVLG